MSQFRKTGTYYVSQWNGDDLNGGTDPLNPFASLNALPSSTSLSIIGSGYYKGTGVGIKILESDGKVVWDLLESSLGAGNSYHGIHIKNFSNIGLNTVQERNHIDNIYDSELNPTICIRRDLAGSGLGNGHFRNIFLKNWRPQGNGGWRNDNSIFIGKMNTVLNIGFAYFRCNFVAFNSEVNLNITTAPGEIYDNCINGDIRVLNNATLYQSKRLIDGSIRPNSDPFKPDIIDVFPNFYTQGNFACLQEDVNFIDVLSRTVETDSILLQKSNANGFIGGVKPAKKIGLAESGFQITKTNINDANPNYWRVADGANFGTVRITGKVSDSLISAQTLDIRIPFFFDGSEAGESTLNNNVPDAFHGLNGIDTLGDLPHRLRFEVRSSVKTNASREVGADWDNGDAGVPGRFYLMEYGQPMLHHILASVAYGNADKFAINAPVKQPFNYRSLDILITISNNRVI